MGGFGAQKIRKFQGNYQNLHAEGKLKKQGAKNVSYTCDTIPEFRFQDAVIDNFAPISMQKKWMDGGQRYWINKAEWGGVNYPIFVFIGGETEESCTRLTDYLFMYDLAQEHRALLVDIEHRYYGQSLPTADVSTENLQYLSSAQALADLARLIDYIKVEYNTTSSKVITFGGSYPGNLAAWFRLKYPSITFGSVASSAPVTAQLNFPEYMEVVGRALIQFGGQACYSAMEEAANKVASLAAQGKEGYHTLDRDFHTCSAMRNEADLSILLSTLMGNVQNSVQVNNEYTWSLNITQMCTTMTDTTADAYTNFVRLQSTIRDMNSQTCEDAQWDDAIAALKERNAGRSWTYQTCNEFGYFQTTDSPNQPFYSWKQLDLDFYRALCRDAFDNWQSDPQARWTNDVYGDVHIAGTNIVFPSGTKLFFT